MAKKTRITQEREVWLNAAMALMISHVFPSSMGVQLKEHKPRQSCAFPKGSRSAIGQCFMRAASADSVNEIFISPEIEDPLHVLAIQAHEAIHAALDSPRHDSAFGRYARAIGLEGKLTATTAGEKLLAQLKVIAKACGDYPHAKLTVTAKDKARQLKAECNSPLCGAIWRASDKWMRQMTACPVCKDSRITVYA